MNNKTVKLAFIDLAISLSALYFSFLLRYEFKIPSHYFDVFISWAPWFALIQVIVFYFAKLYARIWRYTSLFDLFAIVKATSISIGGAIIFVALMTGPSGYPRSVFLLYFILNTVLAIAIRLSVRVYYSHFYRSPFLSSNTKKKRLLLLGAGKTAEKIAREILTTARSKYDLVGFIDDSIEKQRCPSSWEKIFCGLNDLKNLTVDYDELIITSPSFSGNKMREKLLKFVNQQIKLIKLFLVLMN